MTFGTKRNPLLYPGFRSEQCDCEWRDGEIERWHDSTMARFHDGMMERWSDECRTEE
jgi:hypothetical protein